MCLCVKDLHKNRGRRRVPLPEVGWQVQPIGPALPHCRTAGLLPPLTLRPFAFIALPLPLGTCVVIRQCGRKMFSPSEVTLSVKLSLTGEPVSAIRGAQLAIFDIPTTSPPGRTAMPAKRLPPGPVPACSGPPNSRRPEGGRRGSAAGSAGMRPGYDGRTTGVSNSGDHVGGGRRRGASLQGGAASVPDKGCQPRERLRPVLWFLRCRRHVCRGEAERGDADDTSAA